VIRPLALCSERDIAAFSAKNQLPIVPSHQCRKQDNLKRQQVKRLIAELERDNQQVRGSLFAALGNVRPSHLFDKKLWKPLESEQASDDAPAESRERSSSPMIPIEKLLRRIAE
jgi:tRNA 2-thiocytidine biosynthesis protein TtcA